MNKFNPKVSIIIPVYNGSDFLRDAIDSAVAQTYKSIEIIVINDGSNDKGATEKIAKSYGDKIKYYKKENGGVASALNFGIEKMKGEYFSWLSHDDLYYPIKIEKQIEYLKNLDNKKVVLYSDYEVINERSEHVAYVKHDHNMLTIKPEYALLRGCVNGITLLIPRGVLEKNGTFDPELKCVQDYDMWRRIIRKYKFIHMEEIYITKTRVHSKQDTNNHPLAVAEGDKLWIDMMEDLSRISKIRLEGSEYNYYLNMYFHLRKSPYTNAANHAKKKAEDIYSKLSINSSSNPLISVIIPCYNQGKYIDDAVSSILGQKYTNFEIIIINDGSSDKYTNELLKKYNRPKTTVYTTKNQGVTSTRNYGASIARGSLIQFLDADDHISPDKFEQQVKVFKADPKVDVCYTGYKYYFEKDKEYIAPFHSLVLSSNPTEDFIYKWQRGLSIPIHSALFKKSIFDKSTPFVPGMKGSEDWIMWVDISSKGAKFALLNDDMATYRVQEKSVTRNGEHMFYWACRAVSYIANKYIATKDMDRYDKAQQHFLKYLADYLLCDNNQVNELKETNSRLLEENTKIYNSVCWRVTKLPRLIKRAVISFRVYGPLVFFKKFIKKILHKYKQAILTKNIRHN